MRLGTLILPLALALGWPGAALAIAPEDLLNGAEPQALFTQLREMGYAPSYPEKGTPTSILIQARDDKVLVLQGGCSDGKACTYLVLFSYFNDVKAIDDRTLNKLNADFDFIKIWRTEKGGIAYSMGLMTNGLTRQQFRASVEGYLDAQAVLAKDLVAAQAAAAKAGGGK